MPLPLLPLACAGATAAWKAIHSQTAQRIAHQTAHRATQAIHSQAAHRLAHRANQVIHSQAAQSLGQTTQYIATVTSQRAVDMARDEALKISVEKAGETLKRITQ